MVLVPGGEFTMGSPSDKGYPEEHPEHTVDLDAFYIDQYEVTVERYKGFLLEKNAEVPDFWDQID